MEILKIILWFLDKHTVYQLIMYVFLTILLFIFIIWFKYLWIKVKKYNKNYSSFNQKKLLDHSMFSSLKTYLGYEIQNLNINERLRNKIFQDFLKIKFNAIRKSFEKFLEKGDLEKLTLSAYHTRILECINEILRNYETKAIEEGIPQLVIDKFNNWHSERIRQMYELINEVCNDDVYQNNTIRTKIIFDFVVVIINWTIADAKKTLINLNGELSKITYKNITVDPEYLKKKDI